MNTPIASNPEFDRYILETGESNNIDAKGPIDWDNSAHAAGLAKDIAAFANSRDGGVLVIGKKELADGRFELSGLSVEEATSFETTKVAKWVNNHFDPPINLVCHHHEFQGRRFVIITVEEFGDVPSICTKSFPKPSNPKDHILKERTIYVRTSNAESAPIESVEELRTLIGLATAKKGHEMINAFESMLRGRPLLPSLSDRELFEKELATMELGLGEDYSKKIKTGSWKLVIQPAKFREDRWGETVDLTEKLRQRAVQLRSEFPPNIRNTHVREWGICNDYYRETWTLSKSGQFLLIRPYRENDSDFVCSWRDLQGNPAEPIQPAGKWMDFKPSIFTIAEMFMFSDRFSLEYENGERVRFQIQATALTGRSLVTTDSNINRDATLPCRAGTFTFSRESSVEEFRANWEMNCAVAMKQFSDMFPDTSTDLKTMQYWVERFKTRKF